MAKISRTELSKEELQFLKDAGWNMQLIRRGAGVKQYELADILNISRSYITKIEAGTCQPSVIFLKRFCDYFHVTYNEIFDAVDTEKPKSLAMYSKDDLVEIVERVRKVVNT